MPAYVYPREVRDQILARVTAGEPIARVCAEPGMPSYASVHAWGRADPLFAEALAEARRRGEFKRRCAFDEVKAAALLARLAAGEAIEAILRDPDMPNKWTFRYWRMTQAPFQEAVWRLSQGKTLQRAERWRARWLAFDLAIADRLVILVGRGARLRDLLTRAAGFPSAHVILRWRKEQPEFDQALRVALHVGRRTRALALPELTDEITGAIRLGASLAQVGEQPGMPSARTLYAWRRNRPAFAAEVAEAYDDRADLYADQLLMILDGPGSLAARRREIRRLQAKLRYIDKRQEKRRLRSQGR